MRKLDSIESLRGWMAWWVVIGHAIHISGTNALFVHMPLKLLPANGAAVDVFMVISGFVITNLILGKREPYLTYIAKRAWRLLPLMATMIVVSVLARNLYYEAYIVNPWAAEAAMRKLRFSAEEHDWLQFAVLHLTMLHGAIPENVFRFSSTAFLAPAWSISLEWQFYLLAPIIIWAMITPSMLSTCIVAIALGLSYVSIAGQIGTWQYESFLPLAIVYFMVGITVRVVLGRAREGLPVTWRPILITGWTRCSIWACCRSSASRFS
jgi:peptidoglycan/LPS O-acetylase OafA/YrhL